MPVTAAVTRSADANAPTRTPSPAAPAPAVKPSRSSSWLQSAPPAVSLGTSAPSWAPALPTSASSGAPLPAPTQKVLERSFQTNFDSVRVHSDAQGQDLTRSLSTRAVTYGNHIFLGAGERPSDLRVMAHEAAHVVQQRSAPTLQQFRGGDDTYESEAEQGSAAVLRGEQFTVHRLTGGPRMQGLLGISIPDPLDWLAGKANIIPFFRMFTIVLGVNPINMSAVDKSPGNILRALIEILPGGGLITQALDSSGVFEKVANFVAKQIATLGLVGSSIKAAVTDFIKGLSLPRDLLSPGATWERAKRIFTDPIDRIINFAKGLVSGIVQIVKDAILKPIAKLAEGTEGYNLLKGVLGKDPITDKAVTTSAETLLGPLMKMIGLGDVWAKMQQARAIPRAWQWFQTTKAQLIGFVSQIPSLFLAAFKSLTLEDIVLIPKAFAKLANVFGGFIGKFVGWGVDAMWKLLEIVFDVVSPGAFGYVKKTGAALKSILKNPLPFVGNLVKAAKLGFTNFAGNFLNHLKAGLLDWLTGSLPGVYVPKALSLIEFGKLALSVFGVSWAQIRAKIVKALGPGGETIMKVLETTFDVVQALVTGGPVAAWGVIKDKLTDLKDTIVSGITDFIKVTIVTKAIPKLIAMFIPGAGFISAIISIYDTVVVFVNKISKIIQVVTAFVNSIVAIAAGNIGAAAGKVESILAGLLALAINFLAGFVGLGKAANKVMEVINKVRVKVDKALDAAVAWIVTQAKRLGGMIKGKDVRTPEEKQRDLNKAVQELRPQIHGMVERGTSRLLLAARFALWKRQYRLTSLGLEGGKIRATINPTHDIYSTEEVDIGKLLEPILVAAEAQYLREKTGPGTPSDPKMAQARADVKGGKPVSKLSPDEMIQLQRELVSGSLKPAPLGKNIRGTPSTDLTTRGTPTEPGVRVQLRARGSSTPGQFESGQGIYVPDAGNYYPSQEHYDERATGRPLAVNRQMGLALTTAPGTRPALEAQVRANVFLRDVVEPGRVPTMLAANRVASELVARGFASEQEMTTGKMAGATTHESAAAAMRDFQGKTPVDKSGTAIPAAELDKATKVRRGSLGVVFTALRAALQQGGKKALKQAGGPPLARLATAFKSWIVAAMPPPGAPAQTEPEIQRLAAQLRTRLVEFMHSQAQGK